VLSIRQPALAQVGGKRRKWWRSRKKKTRQQEVGVIRGAEGQGGRRRETMAKRGKETGSRDLPYQDKDRYATRLISGATCYLQPPPPSQGSILALDIQQRFSAGHSSIKSSATCFSQDFPLQRCRPDFAHLLRPSNASIGGPLSQQPPRSNAGSEQDAPCRLVRLPYCTRDSETGLRWLHSRRPATSPSR
jgi:hypothetical protein